jgi:hypothetical protein
MVMVHEFAGCLDMVSCIESMQQMRTTGESVGRIPGPTDWHW